MANWGNIAFPNKNNNKKSKSKSYTNNHGSMIQTEFPSTIGLYDIFGQNLIEALAHSTASTVSNELAGFVKRNKWDDYFKTGTGKQKGSKDRNTVDTIGVYKLKTKPIYVTGAGRGVKGYLNYLAGLYRGQAKTESGKVFSYYKPRPVLNTAFREFGVERRLRVVFDEKVREQIKEAEV